MIPQPPLCADCDRIATMLAGTTTLTLTLKGDLFDAQNTHLYPEGGTIRCCRLSTRDIYRLHATYGNTIDIQRSGRAHLQARPGGQLA